MSAIPVIRGGVQALYPVTQKIHFDTFVQTNQNGSEQRWIRNNGLMTFDLTWGALKQSEKDTIKGLVTTAKGQFDASASLTFLGTTYSNLSLNSDAFETIESMTMQYDSKLTFSQVLSQSLSPGTAGQPFPTFRSAISQLPWTQRKRFQSTVNTLASGPRYAWAWFGSGLTNFPTDGMMGWQTGGQSLTDTELSALTAHFIANFGRFSDFSFTDEDGTPYSKTHYASDDMTIVYHQPNQASVSVGLEVTF